MAIRQFRDFGDFSQITLPADTANFVGSFVNYPLTDASGNVATPDDNISGLADLNLSDSDLFNGVWLVSDGTADGLLLDSAGELDSLMSTIDLGEKQLYISTMIAMDDWNDLSVSAIFMSYGVGNTPNPGFRLSVTSAYKLSLSIVGDGPLNKSTVLDLFPNEVYGEGGDPPVTPTRVEFLITLVFSLSSSGQLIARLFLNGYGQADIFIDSDGWDTNSVNIEEGFSILAGRTGAGAPTQLTPSGFEMKNILIGRTTADQQKLITSASYNSFRAAPAGIPEILEEVLA